MSLMSRLKANGSGKRPTPLFESSHLTGDLARRSVSGSVATVTAQAAKFAINFLSVIVLARLLMPEDFGLIAMVTPIVGLVTLVRDMGLSAATIQKQAITAAQVSTLFWINVALSAMLALVIMASAPLVSDFYNEPRLVWVTVAFGATVISGGLAAQHMALLQRQMLFGRLAFIEVTSLLIGFAVAIAGALSGLSYWSLVLMTVATSLTTMALVWRASGWIPGAPARKSGVRSMLAFGGHLTGSNLCQYLNRNLDNILIGRAWGEGALGLYNRAYSLLLMPITQVNGPIGAVAVPALSRLQNDPDRYRSYYSKALGLLATFGMPLVVFTCVDAQPLVHLLLGEPWLNTVPIFQALAPAAFIGSFNVATGWIYVSLGLTARQLRWAILQTPVIVAAFVIGLPYGPLGVAVAYSTATVVLRGPAIAYCLRGTFVSAKDLFGAIASPGIASILAGVGVAAAHGVPLWQFPTTGNFARISIDLAIYGIVYGAIYCLVPGGIRNLRTMIEAASKLKPSAAAAQGAPSATGSR